MKVNWTSINLEKLNKLAITEPPKMDARRQKTWKDFFKVQWIKKSNMQKKWIIILVKQWPQKRSHVSTCLCINIYIVSEIYVFWKNICKFLTSLTWWDSKGVGLLTSGKAEGKGTGIYDLIYVSWYMYAYLKKTVSVFLVIWLLWFYT